MSAKTAPAKDDKPAAPEAAQITLTEFCTRLSANVRRPELLGAFEFKERQKGNVKASAEAFAESFTQFCKTPV